MKRLIYASLRWFDSIQHFTSERLTVAGKIALGAAGAAALAGVDTNQTLTYQAFTLLWALLAVGYAGSLAFRARVALERELPRYATAGEPFSYRVTVSNLGARPLAGVSLAEHFPDPRPGYAEWRAAREPGERRRNWFDRNAGYFRWQWLIERRLPRPAEETPLPVLASGARGTVRLAMTPRRRGRIELAGLTLARRDPLGLVKGLARVAAPARIVALPRRYRVPQLALPGRRRFQQGGVSRVSSVGDSEEFIGLRDYQPGDPLHRVHWKSFARSGRPIVKEFQDEFFERHALVLDTGRADGEDAAFEDSVAVAASFVYTIDTLECLLDLLFVGERVHSYTAGRGQLQADRMLEILAGVRASGPAEFDVLARAVLGQAARLSSCIVILSGWDERRRRFVESLMGFGLQVRALLVCLPEERPAEPPAWLLTLHPGGIEAGLAGLK
jgi:uncharacterized protein (DUF58 family)